MSGSLPSNDFIRKSKVSSHDPQLETRRIRPHSGSYSQLSTTAGAGKSVSEHYCSESPATDLSEELSAGSQAMARTAEVAYDTSSLTLNPSPSNYEERKSSCSTEGNDIDEKKSGKHLQSEDACPPVSSVATVYFKLLVPDKITGIIIGKSGESIVKLQNQCRCRILFSQPRDFYLGTSDRVCVLQGENYEVIKLAVCLVLKKCFYSVGDDLVSEKALETTPPKSILGNSRENDFSVRILVPNSSCGVIIGKGGSNIRSIASATSSKILVTQKQDIASIATSERVVTITGSLQACTSCVNRILDIMESYPYIIQYSNVTTSYKKVGPFGNPTLFQTHALQAASPKPTQTWDIKVPDTLINTLLGQDCSRIKEIQLQSGARIEVRSREESSSEGTNISITGTKDMYDVANLLIKKILSKTQADL